MSTAAPLPIDDQAIPEDTSFAAAEHGCPIPSNRQKYIMCGGPGVGQCVSGKCHCEPQYSGYDCSNCAVQSGHEPLAAPAWGSVATFCTAASTTASISVAQIPLPPSTQTARAPATTNTSSTVIVLAVAGAMLLIMAIALLCVLRKRQRGPFSDGSDVLDAMKAKSEGSRTGASASGGRVAGDTVAVDQSREDSILVDMDTIISNPLALQTACSMCSRCHAQIRGCGVGVPAATLSRMSSSESVQHSRTPLIQANTAGLGNRSMSTSMLSNSNQALGGDSSTARGITWVAQVWSNPLCMAFFKQLFPDCSKLVPVTLLYVSVQNGSACTWCSCM